MAGIGGGFQILGLLAGAASAVFYALGARTGRPVFRSCGNAQRFLMFASVALAFAVLCRAVFADDFSLRYVSLYSDRTLPLIYKISVLWAGQSGALLTACLVMSFLGLFEIWRLEKTEEKYACAVNMVSVLFCCVLSALTVFIASPFAELDFIPVNGSGLPPVLQNVYVFLYPLFSCLWIGGASMVFSHAFAAFVTGDLSPYWINRSRPWIYASWIFALASLFSRSLWSYAVHGDFWNWSVQEMTAVLALLSVIALIHTSMAYEAKGQMKTPCFFFALVFFEAALFSLYLIHSGVKDVITPFKYALCGAYMLGAMLLAAFFFTAAAAVNRKGLRPACRAAPNTRYAALRILNIGFSVVIFFVFAGVLFQTTAGDGSMPGRYYLLVMAPSCVLTVFFMGAVQLYPAFKAGFRRGFRPGGRVMSAGSAASHAGLILVLAGAALSSLSHGDGEMILYPGESASFRGYEVTVNGVKSMQRDNYVSTFVDISLSSGEKMIGNIYPEIRGYNNSNKLKAETKSVFSGLGVVSVAFLSYDFSSGEVRLLIMDNPFVLMTAPGFLLLVFGAFRAVRRGWSN